MARFPEGFEDFHAQNMDFLAAKIDEIRKVAPARSDSALQGKQNMARLFGNSMNSVKAGEYKKWLREQMTAIFNGKRYAVKYFKHDANRLKAMAGLFARLYRQEHKDRPLHERIWRKVFYGMDLNG